MNLKDETMRLAEAWNDAWYKLHDTEREMEAIIAEACEGGEVTIPEHLRDMMEEYPAVAFGCTHYEGVYFLTRNGGITFVEDITDEWKRMGTYIDILHVLAAMQKEKEEVTK